MNIEEQPKSQKTSIFEKLSLIIISAFVGLIPLLVLPQSLIGFSYVKIALATYSILAACILFLAQSVSEGSLLLKPRKVLIALFAVPVVTAFAALTSPHVSGGLIGLGFEFDTVYFLSLGFLLVILCSYLFSTKQRVFTAYLTFFVGFIVIAVVHLLRFAMGVNFLGLQTLLPTMASNTVGAWNDFGAYAGLGVILSFITLELVTLSKAFKWILSAVLVLSLILLGIANFYTFFDSTLFAVPATVIVGLVALFVFVYTVSANYKQSRKTDGVDGAPALKKKYNLPIPSFIVLVFAVVFTIGAQPITAFLYEKIGISQTEVVDVRPTLNATFQVGAKVVESGVVDALFGVGPNRFFASWALFKPGAVNNTIFWNTDFNYGSGYIPTFFVTTGILGFLAWLFFLGIVFFYGWKGAFAGLKDKFSQYLIVSSLLASGYLWLMAFLTVTGPVILLLAFFFTGLLFASLYRENILTTSEFSWISNQKKGFVAVLFSIIIMIAAIAVAFTWTRHFAASLNMNKAIQSANGGDIPTAEKYLAMALQKDLNDAYLRSFSQFRLLQLRQVFEQSKKAELTEKNATFLNDALLASREAALVVNPSNYQNWILLGSIYESAGLLGVDGSGILAKQAYEQAKVLNPTSPLPDLLIARLFAYAQDAKGATDQLQQALLKKADFSEALSLLSQIQSLKPGTAGPVTTPKATSTASSTSSANSTSSTSTKR
ncbi:MAG: hypothetical protein RL094_650 [Candidatus Parcubacteria bacterium]